MDTESIYDAIKHDSGQIGNEAISVSILSMIDTVGRSLNHLDQSFMYTQLVKEILLEMEYDYTLKSKFIEFSCIRYSDNDFQLGLMNEFNENHNRESAI
ncbi:unnamed protein product [Rotaria sordida]|uniref:Uncharacterized protein n=1 Tax=Rotaria sordida TaxID=392033 RepID=A0A818YCH7_9BILA|nr:unnamed protein product [Rotaria sordida]CAF3752154.1 unnamed protein product [Rotaria sordida]